MCAIDGGSCIGGSRRLQLTDHPRQHSTSEPNHSTHRHPATSAGRHPRERALPVALDEYLGIRAARPASASTRSPDRCSRPPALPATPGACRSQQCSAHIRRLARHARLSVADRLSRHSLRHAFATTAREKDAAVTTPSGTGRPKSRSARTAGSCTPIVRHASPRSTMMRWPNALKPVSASGRFIHW